jgi:hypothetical protein
MCPIILAALTAHHTQPSHYAMTYLDSHGIFYRPVPVILRVHISAKMKPRFTVKQNQYGAEFFSIHPQKTPVHRTQFCFMICVVDFVTHSCHTRCTRGDDANSALAVQVTPKIFQMSAI